LKRKVIASTCAIRRVLKSETGEWAVVNKFLQEMPEREYERNVISSTMFYFHTSRETLLKSMRNYGDQGQYNGDIMIPWYMQTNKSGSSNIFNVIKAVSR
jgi:hypothetical protein